MVTGLAAFPPVTTPNLNTFVVQLPTFYHVSWAVFPINGSFPCAALVAWLLPSACWDGLQPPLNPDWKFLQNLTFFFFYFKTGMTSHLILLESKGSFHLFYHFNHLSFLLTPKTLQSTHKVQSQLLVLTSEISKFMEIHGIHYFTSCIFEHSPSWPWAGEMCIKQKLDECLASIFGKIMNHSSGWKQSVLGLHLL